MKTFRLLLNKFYRYWHRSTVDKNSELSIKLSLNPDYTTILDLVFPDCSKLSSAEIVSNAEKYAELILYLNSLSFQKKILDQISKIQSGSDLVDDKLFINNVLIFYDLLNAEISATKQNNGPIIRPITVFNATNR